MLKIIISSKLLILKTFKTNDIKIIKSINIKKADKIVKNLFKSKKLKNKKFKNLMYIKIIRKSIFLNPNAKKTFNYLQ